MLNPLFAILETDESSQVGKLDVELDLFLLDASVGYELGPWPLGEKGDSSAPQVRVIPMVGARYTYMKSELDFSHLPSMDGSEDWLDPIIGVRSLWEFSERWNLVLGGNVGGFDLGGSQLSWEALGAVGYRFSFFAKGRKNANALLGYRALYMDYEDGKGASKFEFDATLHGPILGMSIAY